MPKSLVPVTEAQAGKGLLSVRVLGRFEVAFGDRILPNAAWQRRHATGIFKVLLANPGYRVLREQVLEYLWPGASAAAVQNSFYKALHYLRTALETHTGRVGIGRMIVSERDVLYLAPGLIAEEDAAEFERAAQTARVRGAIVDYERAASLYGGEYLPDDLYESWTDVRRAALRETYRMVLRALTRLYADDGRVAEALATTQRLVQIDPVDEEARRQMMLFYARLGRRTEALRAYRECLEVLRRELDTEPAPETVSLYRAINAGRSLEEHSNGRVARLDDVTSGAEAGQIPRLTPAAVPLVGRSAELQRLRDALALDVPPGRSPRGVNLSGLWLISGEPGIGKSRLLQELMQAALGSGRAVFAGTCSDQEGKLTYGVFIEALRGHLASEPDVWSRILQDQRAHPLTHLLPELGLSLRRAPQTGANLPRAGGAERKTQSPVRAVETVALRSVERQNLFDAVMHALLEAARVHEGALLVLDDLQWADVASLQLLHYLVRKTHGKPVVVIGTARGDALFTDQPLGKVIADLRRRNLYTPLVLQRLNAEETATCAAHILADGDQERVPIAPDFLRYVYQLTEGNPLFIQEMLRLLCDARLVALIDGAWKPVGALATIIAHPRARSTQQQSLVPETIKDLFAERLEQLTPGQQRLLSLAATAGQSIGEDILRLAALATEFTADEFVDAVDALLRAGLLIEEEGHGLDERSGDVGGLYRFSHALVAETVWDRESRARRRWLHGQIGRASETVYRARPDGQQQLRTHAAQLAHYFEQAGDVARELHYHLLAADHARSLFANDEVEYHYRRAIALLEASDPLDTEQLTLAWQGCGEACEWRAAHEEAQSCFERALHYAARPEQRATLYRMRGEVFRDIGRYQEAIAMYRCGEAELPEEPRTVEWARLQLSALSAYVGAGHYQEGLNKLEKALPVLLNCGMEADVARGHSQAAFASYCAGDLTLAVSHARQGLVHARTAGDRVREAICYQQLAELHRMQGATEEALTEIQQAIALKEALGHQVTLAGAYLDLAYIRYTRSEAAAGVEASLRGLDLARGAGSLLDEAYGLFLLGCGHELSGDWDRALETWGEAEAVLQVAPHPETLCLVDSYAARLLLRRGDVEGARTRCERALALDWHVAGSASIAFCLGTRAWVALLTGDGGEATGMAEKALGLVAGMGVPEAEAQAHVVCAAVAFVANRIADAHRHASHAASLADAYHFVYLQLAARRWLGLIAAREQRWDTIERLFVEGMELMQQAPLVYSAAVFADAFATLLAERNAGDAAELRRRATAILERLQAVVLPPVEIATPALRVPFSIRG